MSKAMVPFPTTHWSEVERGGSNDPDVKQSALSRLLKLYLAALVAHVRYRFRLPTEQAEDLVQGFICDQVIARDLLAACDRSRGRFRNFLMTALDRYVQKVFRHDRAAKRSAGAPQASLDPHAGEMAVDFSCASRAFDVAWARQVVGRALQQMLDECDSMQRKQIWRVFQLRVLDPALHAATTPSYDQIARELGFESDAQAANALVTAKRMFARALRTIISEYVADESEIGAELRDLWAILSGDRAALPRSK